MLKISLLVAASLPFTFAAVQCTPGTYWHKRGSVDCDAGGSCTTSPSQSTCCCDCHANYYCPGGAQTQPEDACPAGSTSPPMSTSAANCTGGPPPPSGAFEQIHVSCAFLRDPPQSAAPRNCAP